MTTDLGTPHLRFTERGSLAWCRIDRVHRKNALTSAMYFGIRRAVEVVEASATLRALVITGTEDVFASGGDMGRGGSDGEQDVSAMGLDVLPFRTLRESTVPVVTAVNGTCGGGGLMITLLSDVAVVSDRARFRAPELQRGVADTWFASVLPAHIGIARARDLMMTARWMDADEAVRTGLVARQVPHDELEDAATEVAYEILRCGPEARAQWKRIVNAGYAPVDQVTFGASIRSAECAEGFAAFLDKRAPSWVPPEDAGGRA